VTTRRTVKFGEAEIEYNAPEEEHSLWISGEQFGQVIRKSRWKLPMRARLRLALTHLRGHRTPLEKHKANWHLN
jgi:hypothetical protein